MAGGFCGISVLAGVRDGVLTGLYRRGHLEADAAARKRAMLTRRCVLKFGAVAALSSPLAVFAGPARRPPTRRSRSSPASVFSATWSRPWRRPHPGHHARRPDGDAHVFEPPADARAIADAKVVFINGLGLEQGWMPRLIEAAGYKGPVMVTSKGIKPLRMEEEEEDEHGSKKRAHERGHGRPHMVDDPHAWQNLANGKLYVKTSWPGSPRPIRPVPRRTGRTAKPISARLTSWTPR